MARHGRARACIVATLLIASGCGSDDSGDLEAFCDLAEADVRVEETFDELDPTDVDAAVAAFRAARVHQRQLLHVAPGEVADDVRLVTAFASDLIAGLEQTDPSDDRPDVYDNLRSRFAEVEAAGDRLDAFVEERC